MSVHKEYAFVHFIFASIIIDGVMLEPKAVAQYVSLRILGGPMFKYLSRHRLF
jgi:hypothetical protein